MSFYTHGSPFLGGQSQTSVLLKNCSTLLPVASLRSLSENRTQKSQLQFAGPHLPGRWWPGIQPSCSSCGGKFRFRDWTLISMLCSFNQPKCYLLMLACVFNHLESGSVAEKRDGAGRCRTAMRCSLPPSLPEMESMRREGPRAPATQIVSFIPSIVVYTCLHQGKSKVCGRGAVRGIELRMDSDVPVKDGWR